MTQPSPREVVCSSSEARILRLENHTKRFGSHPIASNLFATRPCTSEVRRWLIRSNIRSNPALCAVAAPGPGSVAAQDGALCRAAREGQMAALLGGLSFLGSAAGRQRESERLLGGWKPD